MRDETSLSGQALEYDLQQILMEDDVKRIATTVIEDGGGGGTGITDVNLTMPLEYDVVKTITGAVIDFVVSWLAQNANKILAGPVSGADAVPGFRYQENPDLPARSRISITPTTFGGTVTPDASLGSQFSLIAISNFTLNPPTGMLDGQKITIRITQDGTGGRTIAFHADYRFSIYLTPGFVALTATAGATDYLGIEYNADAGKWDIIAWVPGVV
jgi:hypothetical protein